MCVNQLLKFARNAELENQISLAFNKLIRFNGAHPNNFSKKMKANSNRHFEGSFYSSGKTVAFRDRLYTNFANLKPHPSTDSHYRCIQRQPQKPNWPSKWCKKSPAVLPTPNPTPAAALSLSLYAHHWQSPQNCWQCGKPSDIISRQSAAANQVQLGNLQNCLLLLPQDMANHSWCRELSLPANTHTDTHKHTHA